MSSIPSQTPAGPARASFTLASAQRIASVVRAVEAQAVPNNSGGANPARPAQTQFWAMITSGADLKNIFFNWVACVPSKDAGTGQDSTTPALSNLWEFQQPYVAGFGNAREANGNKQIPPGTVVMLTLIGYSVPDGTAGSYQGTSTVPASSTAPPTRPDGSIPMYVFSYCMQQQQQYLPLHDHRDNVTGGGFSFATYHPGTALPQQPFSI
jgi:hypothetical protein